MSKRSVALVGILILMVMVGSSVIGAVSGIASHSQQAEPSNLFLPLIMKAYQQIAGGDTGILYVFFTVATTDGNGGGRPGMDSFCTDEDPESHFCSLMEIENAMATTGVRFESVLSTSWLDIAKLGSLNMSFSGDPNDSDWTANNCNAWQNGSSISGLIMNPPAESVGLGICAVARRVTCCKQLP